MEVRDPFIGTILDRRYRIEERIAAGGFGAIYRAVHVRSEMQLAIKVLHPRLSADERIVARFRREGATLTSLRSPHTVTTYELAQDPNGTLFIVMELLRGQTLLERFQAEGAMPWRSVVAIARAVCDALAEAHALGVVHRDLKPANIHLSRRDADDSFVKVLDFGIAKLLRGSGIEEGTEELTNHNEVIGTFEYISPEQIAGDSYSGRSDIYTLGILMYEMTTGARPFGNLTGPALMATIFSDVAKPPSTQMPGLPPAFDELVLKCLERDPDRRHGNVHELATALDELLGDHDVTGESATAVGAMLDPRILHGDDSTSITPRSHFETVETATVRKPAPAPLPAASPTEELPTPQDPVVLDADSELDTQDSEAAPVGRVGRDTEVMAPLRDVIARNPPPPLTPPLEPTQPRLSQRAAVVPPRHLSPPDRGARPLTQPPPLPPARPGPPAATAASAAAAVPPARPAQTTLPPPSTLIPPRPSLLRPVAVPPAPRASSPPMGREAVSATSQGLGIGTAAPASPEAGSTVFATLEGWQAPPLTPGSLSVASATNPAQVAADRERRILLWAAVLGIAILIGFILAVSV